MDFSANLTLPYILPNQAQKHVTLNESLRRLDALVQISVISMDETDPPSTPEEGDRYVPAAASTGPWAGNEGNLVAYQDGAWEVYPPEIGWIAWVEADGALAIYDGADWVTLGPASELESLGINAVADQNNRLILSANASLFDHEGSGHQLKINKATDADTGSLVFQTAYQGHAEMGLSGNNDFNVKVSPNGQTFLNAILIRHDNGNVGVDTYWPTAKLDVSGPVRIGQVTWAELPNPANVGAGALIYVSDQPGGASLAFSDGTNWRTAHDRSVV
ncbi:MAG: DUF2793 domain-containing protein [Henriciella sp.]